MRFIVFGLLYALMSATSNPLSASGSSIELGEPLEELNQSPIIVYSHGLSFSPNYGETYAPREIETIEKVDTPTKRKRRIASRGIENASPNIGLAKTSAKRPSHRMDQTEENPFDINSLLSNDFIFALANQTTYMFTEFSLEEYMQILEPRDQEWINNYVGRVKELKIEEKRGVAQKNQGVIIWFDEKRVQKQAALSVLPRSKIFYRIKAYKKRLRFLNDLNLSRTDALTIIGQNPQYSSMKNEMVARMLFVNFNKHEESLNALNNMKSAPKPSKGRTRSNEDILDGIDPRLEDFEAIFSNDIVSKIAQHISNFEDASSSYELTEQFYKEEFLSNFDHYHTLLLEHMRRD